MVVETARHILDYIGGTLVLVEPYWSSRTGGRSAQVVDVSTITPEEAAAEIVGLVRGISAATG